MTERQRPEFDSTVGQDLVDNFRRHALLAGKIVGGGIAGAAVMANGANLVHAHDSQIVDETDTSERLFMEPGDTIWVDALAEGYTPEEIIRDLNMHGFTSQEQKNYPGLPVGYVWEVSPEVQQSRLERIGNNRTETLEKGETVWGQAVQAGVAEEDIPELLKWIEDSGGNQVDVKNLPIGYTFTIPERLLKYQEKQAIIPLGSPTLITIEAGSSIYEELKNEGIENPMNVLDDVLEANDMDSKDATDLMPGAEIIVPAGILSNDDVTATEKTSPLTLVIEEGSSVIKELENAGVKNPMQIVDDVLAANKMDQKDARSIRPGTKIVIPADLIVETSTGASINPLAVEDSVVQPAENIDSQTVAKEAEQLTVQESIAPKNLIDVLVKARLTYETGSVDIAEVVDFIVGNFQHPDVDEDNGITQENVNLLYKLPPPQEGLDYVVNPQTCAKESIVSAPMLASIIVSQDYAHWLTENYGQFNSENGSFRLDVGDINSGVHKTHQYGQAVDLRSIFVNSTDFNYPDGPMFMPGKPGFNLPFTETVVKFMKNQTYNGRLVLKRVITSSKQLETSVMGVNKNGDFVSYDGDGGHFDHIHVDMKDEFTVPGYYSPALPLSCDDPATGGHTEFEQQVQNKPIEESPVPDLESSAESSEELFAPESNPVLTPEGVDISMRGYWVSANNGQQIIDESNLSAEQKEFLRETNASMIEAINSGANINPRVALAQAIIESGWGTGKGAVEGNNIFSVKASRKWADNNPDKVVWIYDDEFDSNNNRIPSAFKKYDSVEDAFLDYSRMITEAEHYDDAERCRGDDTAYLNGLIHELRQNCSIGRVQGEDGVLSYATNDRYVEIISEFIKNSPIDKLIVLNPDEQQRQATQEWLLLHAG